MENIHFLGMKDTNEREILGVVCLVFLPSNILGFISEIEIKGQFCVPLELMVIKFGIILSGWLQKYLELSPVFCCPIVSHFSR